MDFKSKIQEKEQAFNQLIEIAKKKQEQIVGIQEELKQIEDELKKLQGEYRLLLELQSEVEAGGETPTIEPVIEPEIRE